MAFNVSVVYDVFAVAIKECEAFQQPQKCGGVRRGSQRRPSRTEPEPRRGEVYTVLLCEVSPYSITPLFYCSSIYLEDNLINHCIYCYLYS